MPEGPPRGSVRRQSSDAQGAVAGVEGGDALRSRPSWTESKAGRRHHRGEQRNRRGHRASPRPEAREGRARARGAGRLEALAARIVDAGGRSPTHPPTYEGGPTRRLVKLACERYGRLDVFVNNAGVMPVSALDELRVEDWRTMIDVNLKGVLYGIAAALPVFREQGFGQFVNIASTAGHVVRPNMSVYCGTKFAVRAISEGLRQEAGERLRVTIISPGMTRTSFAEGMTSPEARAQLVAMAERIAMPPASVARAIRLRDRAAARRGCERDCRAADGAGVSPRSLLPADLESLTARTVASYDASADAFREGTRDHDVSQNVRALLGAIEGPPPFTILDFGCGPGRDLATFRALGHQAVGLDGAARFVEMAHVATGCEVLHQNFLELSLPPARYDGVFANASLFHVPAQELPRVLRELRDALRDRGVLFSSNPRGSDIEGWNGARYGAYHSLETWRAVVLAAGFEEVDHYYRPPGKPREEQPWLATVWRKT